MTMSVEIRSLVEALAVCRNDYKDMTVSQLIAFLMFSQAEGVSIAEVSKKLAVSDATISRMLDKLSDGKTGALKVKGMNYVKTVRGQFDDDRRISVKLTKKGETARNHIITILRGSHHGNTAAG